MEADLTSAVWQHYASACTSWPRIVIDMKAKTPTVVNLSHTDPDTDMKIRMPFAGMVTTMPASSRSSFRIGSAFGLDLFLVAEPQTFASTVVPAWCVKQAKKGHNVSTKYVKVYVQYSKQGKLMPADIFKAPKSNQIFFIELNIPVLETDENYDFADQSLVPIRALFADEQDRKKRRSSGNAVEKELKVTGIGSKGYLNKLIEQSTDTAATKVSSASEKKATAVNAKAFKHLLS